MIADVGLILLAADGSIATTDAAGAEWLAELTPADASGPLPDAITVVVRRAAEGESHVPARAYDQARSGVWVVVRGSELTGFDEARVAVTIEPVRAHDLAPVAADA